MIGKVIGNYRILSKIGEGGMGAVYLARDLTLEREVALKIIAPRLAKNPKLMARFKIEAVAQARLTHPNVVTIYSFEQVGDLYFIVMEYIDGKSLKTMIESGELDIKESLEIFKQILAGVSFAHSRGVIHRDIKPANVLITKTGIAKIGDFGIAKLEGVEGLTRAGTSLGTPLYSAPEQILGRKVDHRADIYSLGVVLFEMLTGRPPFVSETGSDYEIQKAHIEKKPPRPSSLNPEIPPVLDKIVMKCLEKDPSRRFSSVDELRRTIEQVFPSTGYTPTSSRTSPKIKPPASLSSLILKLKTDRKALILTLAILILIAIVLVILIVVSSSASPTSVYVPQAPTQGIARNMNTSSSPSSPSTGPSANPPPNPAPENPSPPPIKPSQKEKEPPKPTKKTTKPETVVKGKKPVLKTSPYATTPPDERVANLIAVSEFSRAAALADQLLQAFPENPKLMLEAGRAYFLSGDYDKANIYLKRAFYILGYIRFYLKRIRGYSLERESYGWFYLRKGEVEYKTQQNARHNFVLPSWGIVEVKVEKKPWDLQAKILIKGQSRNRKIKAKFVLGKKKTSRRDAEFLVRLINKLTRGGKK